MVAARFSVAFLLLTAGCAIPQKLMPSTYSAHLNRNILIDSSAVGWLVKLGPQDQTILVNPEGRTFDMGQTSYPDIGQARLYRFAVKELDAEFLILYVPPFASGGNTMTLFTVLGGGIPVRAADITTHCESWDIPGYWKEALFADSDGDGVLELVENNAYRWKGNKTYYAFDGKRFAPLWIDEYCAPEHDDYNMQFVARHKAK